MKLQKIPIVIHSWRKPAEGTRLGLSVIHGIVKNYKDAITVESRLGKGTVFLYLPSIIICKGFSDNLDNETAKAHGIKDYLHKPILINDLFSKVRNVLETAKEIGAFQTFAKDSI